MKIQDLLDNRQRACYTHYCQGPWYALLLNGTAVGRRIYGVPIEVTLDVECVLPDERYSAFRIHPIASPYPTDATAKFIACATGRHLIADPEVIDLADRADCSRYICDDFEVLALIESATSQKGLI